jgi:periplasmic protein TonB
MRRDLVVSLMGHVALIALIIIINPVTTRLGTAPDIMTVDLSGVAAPAQQQAKVTPPPEEKVDEIKPPETPEMTVDQDVEEAFSVKSPDTTETIVAEKPEPKPKPKPKRETEKKPPTEKKPELASTNQQSQESETEGVSEDGKGGLDVSTGVGSGAGGGSGSGNFTLPYNLALLERKIERVWHNPVSSPSSVSCTIYFQVGRDGYLIGDPVIEKSSGISVFDQEAIYAVKRVERFPEFPSGFSYDYIGVHMEFTYAP